MSLARQTRRVSQQAHGFIQPSQLVGDTVFAPALRTGAMYSNFPAPASLTSIRTNWCLPRSFTTTTSDTQASAAQGAAAEQVKADARASGDGKGTGDSGRGSGSSGGRPKPNLVRALRNGLILMLGLATAGYTYLEIQERKRAQTKATVTSYQTTGEIKLGGPWSGLVDQDGQPASSDDYLGKYMLIYFGFTHCPDICPTEINKMMDALDKIEKTHPQFYKNIKTVFISVDPDRDTVARLKEYSTKFHPRMRWVTGPMDKIREAAKKYRVYFSIPDDIQPGEDYLVDHSIFFYMMDRDGKFMEFFGKNSTADEIATRMVRIIDEDLKKRP